MNVKLKNIKFLFLLFTTVLIKAQKPPTTEGPPIKVTNINNYNYNYQVQVNFQDLEKHLKDFLEKTKSKFVSHSKLYLFYISLTIGILIWGWAYYQIKKTENLLKKNNSWLSWKNHLNLKHLFNAPKEDLAKDLLETINIRSHTNNENESKIIFIKEIKNEKKILKKYLRINLIFQRLHLCWLLPKMKKLPTQEIIEKKQRLDFLKSIISL